MCFQVPRRSVRLVRKAPRFTVATREQREVFRLREGPLQGRRLSSDVVLLTSLSCLPEEREAFASVTGIVKIFLLLTLDSIGAHFPRLS